jgi:hypothetical protein
MAQKRNLIYKVSHQEVEEVMKFRKVILKTMKMIN